VSRRLRLFVSLLGQQRHKETKASRLASSAGSDCRHVPPQGPEPAGPEEASCG